MNYLKVCYQDTELCLDKDTLGISEIGRAHV